LLPHRPQASELPTDVDFKWAQDSYNATQRTVDTWVFFSVFRTRLWLLDQKWSYVGGFTGAGAGWFPMLWPCKHTHCCHEQCMEAGFPACVYASVRPRAVLAWLPTTCWQCNAA
jgi:hypothetical protein